MGKYQTYSEYRSWNNKWISCLPASWQLVPLKYICSGFVKDGPHETPKFTDDGIPFLSVDGIQDNKLVFNGCRYISEEDHVRYSMKCHPKQGDVLLGKAASVGKVAYVDSNIDFNVWSPLAVITAKSNKYGKYIYYCLQSSMLQAQCEVFANSNTQKNLGMNTIDNLDMPLPSENEADAITNFLDHETAKIDTLIEKQQQLIKLLKEKRQAVISHAVTNGLNPQAPMKDSGVEWFDSVPSHWKVAKFSYLAQVVRGGSPRPAGDPTLFDGDYSPWVTVAEITKDTSVYLEKTSSFLTKKGSEQCRVFRAGTLLISNSGATLGVPKILQIDANANDGVVGFESLKLNPEFAYFYLSTLTERLRTQIKSTGGSTQINLNTDIVKEISVPIPPKEEVQLIVDYIVEQIDVFSQLASKAETLIQLMQERRTALISAAVTGKIDVRNWQAPSTSITKILEGEE
ncbi:restriction endonuclease subunit S [Vibrio parahaemolyticus]|nr:restriction endonuclease subunit S [Vibrio parahaemolyticus]MBE3739445.1 restriction endonuclease subunit S [Vibrio parahaemolyticus]